MVKKIAIVGTSESSVKLSDCLDDSWEVWGCNGAYQLISGVDKHFELHPIPYLKDLGIIPEYLEYMEFMGSNLIINGKYPELPNAVSYPIEEIVKHFKIKYFNNTISYMVAYALYTNPDLEDLALLGVDMAADTEYAHQRPCTEFFLGYAHSKGIRITIPDVCPLLKATHLYAFEKAPGYVQAIRKRNAELASLKAKYDKERENALINQAYAKGLHDENNINKRLYT